MLAIFAIAMLPGCNQVPSGDKEDSASVNEILPNPNKVYDDQCYVWLKEMPDFFRERHYLEDGIAWDRHSYQGIYVSDDPKSMFFSRHYVGQTVLLFESTGPEVPMARKNIVYQYSLSQGNDGDGDQIWVLGEFRPPHDCVQWVLAATGKFRGVRSEGVWHWNWPENRNWEQPENPPGYNYPNAEEFNYQYPEETDGQPELVGSDYWIETIPYGVTSTEPVLGYPATEKPAKTERITDRGYCLMKKLPDVQQRQLIPPGKKGGDAQERTGFDHYNFEGVFISENPTSPFNNRPLTGKYLGLYTPESGEDMTSDNRHCAYMSIQTGDPEGNQIWWWGESFPPQKPTLTMKVATGKFEGLSGIGTWYDKWPNSHKKPANMKGYDHAIACDFTYDMPVK